MKEMTGRTKKSKERTSSNPACPTLSKSSVVDYSLCFLYKDPGYQALLIDLFVIKIFILHVFISLVVCFMLRSW